MKCVCWEQPTVSLQTQRIGDVDVPCFINERKIKAGEKLAFLKSTPGGNKYLVDKGNKKARTKYAIDSMGNFDRA